VPVVKEKRKRQLNGPDIWHYYRLLFDRVVGELFEAAKFTSGEGRNINAVGYFRNKQTGASNEGNIIKGKR
jgi:hypothetical protein